MRLDVNRGAVAALGEADRQLADATEFLENVGLGTRVQHLDAAADRIDDVRERFASL